MSRTSGLPTPQGPFLADQIRPGDPYELSGGHAIQCLPTGARGSRANLLGGSVLETDPAVDEAGVDTGFSPSQDVLRAPDVAVGNVPDEPGWVDGVPQIAVEYADTGQDEKALADKIPELLGAGTKLVWVVRMGGPRRVEVHKAGRPMRLVHPGEELEAPGILRNPVAVEALYDREVAHEATLRNLLQRRGYADLDAVLDTGREEGRSEGRSEGSKEAVRRSIREVLAARDLVVDDDVRAALDACEDPELLRDWLRKAATASALREVFG